MKIVKGKVCRRWISYGAVSSRSMWFLCGAVLAILALNGWMMTVLYRLNIPDVYLGNDVSESIPNSVSVPNTVLGVEGAVLGILVFAFLAFRAAMSRRRER